MTFEKKIKTLKKIGCNVTIECEEHLDYELKCIKDADPNAYHKYLALLSMKEYRVTEEVEIFHHEGYNLLIPEKTIIDAKMSEEGIWSIMFNGIYYWQYNYSIEDKIEEVK